MDHSEEMKTDSVILFTAAGRREAGTGTDWTPEPICLHLQPKLAKRSFGASAKFVKRTIEKNVRCEPKFQPQRFYDVAATSHHVDRDFSTRKRIERFSGKMAS